MLDAAKARTGERDSRAPSTSTIHLTCEQRLDQALRYTLLMHDLRVSNSRTADGPIATRA